MVVVEHTFWITYHPQAVVGTILWYLKACGPERMLYNDL